MEIVGRVSSGSKMDQIYIPKNRAGLAIGSYVLVKAIEGIADQSKESEKLYFYGLDKFSPIKIMIIKEIFKIIEKAVEKVNNIFITGSFLDNGFCFNDVDIVITSEKGGNDKELSRGVSEKIGLKTHIISLTNKELVVGLEIDPLYQLMLSRCVSKKRFVYSKKQKINYKLLDLHLLKSKSLIDNFEFLTGKDKYDLTRNMIAISLYLDKKELTTRGLDVEIVKRFGLKGVDELKHNLVEKKSFLKRYKEVYGKVFDKIMRGLERGAK